MLQSRFSSDQFYFGKINNYANRQHRVKIHRLQPITFRLWINYVNINNQCAASSIKTIIFVTLWSAWRWIKTCFFKHQFITININKLISYLLSDGEETERRVACCPHLDLRHDRLLRDTVWILGSLTLVNQSASNNSQMILNHFKTQLGWCHQRECNPQSQSNV